MKTSGEYYQFIKFILADVMEPVIALSSLNATSVHVSLTQPPLSFSPVSYTLELERVSDCNQTHCTGFEANTAPISIPAGYMSVEVTGLEEASTYTVTVNAIFNEFDTSITTTTSLLYNTSSAREYDVKIKVQCGCVHSALSMLPYAIHCI